MTTELPCLRSEYIKQRQFRWRIMACT